MHPILPLLFFLLSFSSFARVVNLESSNESSFSLKMENKGREQELVLEWKLDSFEAKEFKAQSFPLKAQDFSQIELEGFSTTRRPMAPSLPYHSFIVVGELEQLDLQIEMGEDHFFAGLHAAPSPLLPCRCGPQEKTWGLKFDDPLNQYHYRASSLGDFRGMPLTQIIVSPFSASSQGLKVSDKLKLSVRGAQGLFDFAPEWERSRTGRYLIIAPQEFMTALKPLIEWRESQGHEVIPFVYRGESFEKLRDRLHQFYHEEGYDFALIVGSEERIPMQYIDTSTDWNTPTDMNYFTKGGENDLIPDIIYARMAVNSAREIEGQIEKTINYELSHYQDNSGLERALGIASDEGHAPSDYEYVQQMLAPLEQEFQVQSQYFFQRQRNATAENLIQSLSQGAHWLNYIGHGIGDAWPSITGRALNVDDFKRLSPHGVKPVVIDVACQNGRLTFDRRIGVTLMNQFNQDRPAGAVAYYGGTVDVTWHPPAMMAVKINEVVARRQLDQLGPAIMAGQLKMIEVYDDLPSALENLIWYHLQGDPALELQWGL